MTDRKPSALQTKIARDIISLVRRRQLKPGQHVTESLFIDEFGVSRAPIRVALGLLASNGLMEQKPGRGYFVTAQCLEMSIAEVAKFSTLDDGIVVQLAKDVMSGRIGEKFTQASFRRLYGIGRLTSSRILHQLAEDGVLSRGMGNWWHVEPTLQNYSSFNESLDFRLIVEPAAILSPTFHLDIERAKASKLAHQRLLDEGGVSYSARDFFELDAEFHIMIGEASGNRFLSQSIVRQTTLRRLVEYEGVYEIDRLLESSREHIAIIEVLLENDRKAASKLMSQHLKAVRAFAPEYEAQSLSTSG